MTLDVKVGTVTKDTTSGSHTQAFASELGFTPKGIIFWGGSEIATGIISDANLWMGFTNGTTHRVNTVSSNDGAANGAGSRIQSNARCVQFAINGATTNVAGGTCTFTANGFSIVWTTANTVAYKINYFAFGGTDITNVAVQKIDHLATGTQSYTATGFQGDIAFFIPMIAAENAGGTTSGAMFAFGAAMSSSKQFAIAYSSAEAPINTQKIQRTDKCIYAIVEAGTDSTVASFVGFTSTGFDLDYTVSNTAADTFVMVVKGGAWDVGSFSQKTSTGTQDVTISGVDPSAVLLSSFGEVANTALVDNANFSLGGSDGTNEICHWLGDEHGAANAIAKQDYSDTKAIRLIDETSGGGTLLAEADVTSLATAGKFTLDWTTADSTAREICYVALGVAAAAGNNYTGTVSDTVSISEPSLDRILTANRVPSADSSTISDSSLTRMLSATRAPSSDTATITDASLTRSRSRTVVPSTDTSTVTDSSLVRLLSSTRNPGTDTTAVTAGTVTRNTQAFRVPASDTTTVVDATLTRSRGLPRLPSTDSTTVVDSSLSRLLSAARVPTADTTTVTAGTSSRVLSALRIPSTDSTSVVDVSLTQQKAYTRTPSDTTVSSDSSLTRLLSAIRVPAADTITVTAGTTTRMLSALRVPSLDTIASTENVTGGKVYGRIPATDTVTIADSALTRLLSLTRNPSDTTIVGENLIRMLSAFRTTAPDTTTVADVTVLRTRSLTRTTATDVATVVDFSLTRLLSALRLPASDTTTINENLTAAASGTVARSASDTITATDGTLNRSLSAVRIPSSIDTIAIADSSLTRILSASRTGSDTITIADTSLVRMLQLVRSTGTDTIALSESISSALTTAGVFTRSASDTVAIAEAALTRLLSSVRTVSTDTTAVSENAIIRSITRIRSPAIDSVTVLAGTVTRARSLLRLPTQDTSNIIETSLIRLLSLARSLSENVVVSEVQNEISHSRALLETVGITEPLLQRVVSASRSLNDIVNISEAVFFQTYHKYVFDTVVVAEQLFRIRTSLSGAVTYATPDEVRPLLGNLGSQRTDDQINLAIDAAYDEINTKTNRIPPNDWKDTDHNFGIVKKLARYIAAKEMAIGIKDFDTAPLQMEIDHLFNDLLTYDTTSDATQDIVGSSPDVTYALNEGGLIWSTRYPNLKKGSSGENDTTINPDT